MAYFRCTTGGSGKGNTLVVTCADDLAGATITCTNGTKTYTKTCPSTAPYEVTFYGLEAGTWTVSATVSGNTYTTTVVITDYEAELGGFNWKAWVDLSQNYTSSDFTDLDDLLSDETAIRELMTIHACVDYLAEIAAASADVEQIIENDYCAKWINLRDYALDTLYANEIIAGYMDAADKYFYGEWALMPQVPKMTSDSAPYGTAYTNAVYASKSAYLAFDGNDSTYAAFISAVNNYLQYSFVSPTRIKRVRVKIDGSNNNYKIQVSNDGFSSDIRDIATLENVPDYSDLIVDVESDYSDVSSARIIQTAKNGTASGIAIYSLQFYAWAPKGNVPVMTSLTAPYGTVSASSISTEANSYAYNAFNSDLYGTYWRSADNSGVGAWIEYKFTNPVCVKRVAIGCRWWSNVTSGEWTLSGSNDGTTYDTIQTGLHNNGDSSSLMELTDIENTNYYLYYRLTATQRNVSSANVVHLSSLQFYGRELSVSVPKMDTNTTPYGEVVCHATVGNLTSYPPYQAFNGNATGGGPYNSTKITGFEGSYIGYDFKKSVPIKMIDFAINTAASGSSGTLKIIASDDGITWTPLSDAISYIPNVRQIFINPSTHAYKMYALRCESQTQAFCFLGVGLQFFGLDYSEKEFEEGTNKKWLYDHGVELESITIYNQSGNAAKKMSDYLYCDGSVSGNYKIAFMHNIDLTNYELLRAKAGDYAQEFELAVYDGEPYYGKTAIASMVAVATDLPNNIGLSVDAINQAYNVCVRSLASNKTSCTELWLE